MTVFGAGYLFESFGVSEICDGEDLWQWSRLEIKLKTFRRSTIQQRQFIIFIIIIIIIIIINEIQVNFSDRHSDYFDAWSYVTKEDTEFLQSENHPVFSSGYIPHTKASANKKKECGSGHSSRKRSFKAVDLSDVILAKKIKNKSQLLKFVYEQKQEDKTDLPLYVLNNIDKSIKLINITWEMESAVKVLERVEKTRMDLLHEVNSSECVKDCG